MVRALLLRAEAAASRCNRSSSADETLTKGFSVENPALICFMSARQLSSTTSISFTIAPPAKLTWGLNQAAEGNGYFLDSPIFGSDEQIFGKK
jgi:hypothetical protein